jgi:putative ABC transport system permease protein
MTIVGIAGCTGLMLTGFGIRDSVVKIPTEQYGGIFKYEISISLLNTDGINEIEQYAQNNENIVDYSKLYATSGTLKKDKKSYDITMFIPNDNDAFKNVCNLINTVNDEEVNLTDNGIIITDKVAEMLNVVEGEEVTLIDADNIEHNFKIDAVVKNYVSHFVYMSKDFYTQNIKSYDVNMLLVNVVDDTDTDKLAEDLLNIDGVSAVSNVSTLVATIDDMLTTMNYVVVILIVASALLAFVVLYNLANINIGERQREIATLKVLGFYDKEVDNYINKESIIFTLIGIILGLIFGTFLTKVIVASVEIDSLKFIINVKEISYVYSAIMTASFSFIVNGIIHFVLKKIDMIESLKSVE